MPEIANKTEWSSDPNTRVVKEEESKASTIHLVIQTNSDDKKYIPLLQKAWDIMTGKINVDGSRKGDDHYIRHFLRYDKEDKTDAAGREAEYKKIIDIKTNVSIQIGKDRDLVHLDAVFDINHRTWVQLYIKAIRELFERITGRTGLKIEATATRRLNSRRNVTKLREYSSRDVKN